MKNFAFMDCFDFLIKKKKKKPILCPINCYIL